MTKLRASWANTIGSDRIPLVDAGRHDFDAPRFLAGQVAMMAIASEELAMSAERKSFRLSLSLLARLHRAGYAFVDPQAGHVRRNQVMIEHSDLVPPPAEDVLGHLEEMCLFINDNCLSAPPLFIAAYALWRLLWIHPFLEGNGSVARIVCYMLVCVRSDDATAAGASRLFDFIANHRERYYDALSSADHAWAAGSLDLDKLEQLLQDAMG